MKQSHRVGLIARYLIGYIVVSCGVAYSSDCDSSKYHDSVDRINIQNNYCFIVGERHRRRLFVPLVVESDSVVSIRSKLTGYVSEIYVKEGDRVAKGERLILVDDPNFNDSLTAARMNLAVVRDKLRTGEEDFKRISRLFDNKQISKAVYDKAELSLKISRSEFKAAEEIYESTKKSSSYSLIQSPYDGLVRSVDARVGQLAHSGLELMVLNKIDDFLLKGWVPASYISRVMLDGAVDVEISGVSYNAEVVFISDEINMDYQSVEIKLKTGSKIIGGLSGMYGAAHLRFRDEVYGGYLIPKQAVF